MNHLPLEQRALLMRLYVQGVPHRQIATQLGISRATVRRYVTLLTMDVDITNLDAYTEYGEALR